MCESHYRASIPAEECIANECASPGRKGRGYCSKHYQRLIMGKDPNENPFGKTYLSPDGYVVEYDRNHIQGHKGKILQHRRVYSDFLGRKLESYENIHHKNGVKSDNRLENLELWVKRQPAGQRVEDLIEWAKWILQEYDNDK